MKGCGHAILCVYVCGMLTRVYQSLYVCGNMSVWGYMHVAENVPVSIQCVHMNAEAEGQFRCFPYCSPLY